MYVPKHIFLYLEYGCFQNLYRLQYSLCVYYYMRLRTKVSREASAKLGSHDTPILCVCHPLFCHISKFLTEFLALLPKCPHTGCFISYGKENA